MWFLVVVAAVATLGLALLALLVWGVMRVLGRRPKRYWWPALFVIALLAPFNLVGTAPLVMGWMAINLVGTRSDERAYAGPRVAADGTWVEQTRTSLRAEAAGEIPLPELVESAERSTLRIEASDGVGLRAFLVEPVGEPRFSAVLVHGLFRGALELEPVGRMLHSLGAEVMLLELRNHGGSDRATPTFGLHETRDVVAAVQWLRARPGQGDRRIVLFGVSLGTAAVAGATRELEGLDGLILDAPMDDLERTAYRVFDTERAQERGFAMPEFFRWLVLRGIEFWGGFDCADVCPGEALRDLPKDLPVLLIGGGDDRRMPPDEVSKLFAQLPTDPGKKQLWIRSESDHGRVWIDDPDGYRQHLERFVRLVLAD